jgi:hypothetical protein
MPQQGDLKVGTCQECKRRRREVSWVEAVRLWLCLECL